MDYIEVAQIREPGPAPSAPAPRDFTPDDGAPALHFSGPIRLYRNGLKIQDGLGYTVREGATIYFVVPGQGRYVLSLAPFEGFRKLGAIRDHALSFQVGSDSYEMRTGGPILGAGKAWNLYLYHDPRFKSDVKVSPAIYGGVDRLENLVRGDDPLQEMFRRLQGIRK